MRREFYLKQVKRNSKNLSFFFLALISFGCGKEKLSEEVLVKVYVENIIADQTYASNADSLRIQKELVFKKYGLTEKEFKNELEKYYQDKNRWTSFFKKSYDYLDELKKSGAIN